MSIVYAIGVLSALGLVFGGLLTLASNKFGVETDERVSQIRDALPGANCGACGYVGCDSFAEAVAKGEASPGGCKPGGASTAAAIGAILGVDVASDAKRVAQVLCQGTQGVAKERYIYDGLRSCRVAAGMAGGPRDCRFACVGLGDCEASCRFDAIEMKDGIAYIDEEKCVGCEACVAACPRNVIEMKKPDADVIVRCRNSDVAREARAVCMKACIGCKRCVKECQYDAIHVENGFARIDDDKCTRCGDCARVCPCKCITIQGVVPE